MKMDAVSDCHSYAVQSRIRVARVIIKIIILAIWVLYIIIWAVTPTKFYANSWWHVIMEKTNTIYFRDQGMAILIYTVPVLLVAVLGCVYLHLGTRINLSRLQQHNKRYGNRKFLTWWKRLCLTKGSLGIVTRTEVAFLAMFIILLVYSFLNYVHRDMDWIHSVKPDVMKRSLVVLELVALLAGLVGNICLAFMFFPVTRGSSILPLFGLSYESSIRYHIWISHISMVLFTAHGALYVLFWALTSDLKQMLEWDEHGISNVAGEVSLMAGIVIWLTTFPKIRKNMFELFFYTHHLYIIFIVFFMLHLGLYFTCMMLPGFYLFVLDRYLRLLQSQQCVKLISARVLPNKFVELNFAKSRGLKYLPTSFMFVNVPSISRLQWHPFTICSNSDLELDSMSVLIKSEGSWSTKLHHILSAHPSVEHLPVSVEGPYGPASNHFLRYDTIVMVSGGSGIAPFISIIRGLIHGSSNALKSQKVVLVSAVKCSTDLILLDVILPLSALSSSTLLSNLDIRIEAYVTREHEPSKSSEAISTIWFKTKNSDALISPTLGPNSWLWLAMIISASFAISLVLISLATIHFIYPVDKNTDRIYSISLKTMINIICFLVSIVVSASAAFMWNKRHKANEASQMDNIMVLSPNLELESLPGITLAQVTNVHYGVRPDFRKILNECGGSCTGVLVCGPKGMQSDVASICMSSSKDNVHFESISFSW